MKIKGNDIKYRGFDIEVTAELIGCYLYSARLDVAVIGNIGDSYFCEHMDTIESAINWVDTQLCALESQKKECKHHFIFTPIGNKPPLFAKCGYMDR